jgi:uncharacterized protein
MPTRRAAVPLGRLKRAAPGLPSRDIVRTVAHYHELGFSFTHFDAPTPAEACFAIGERDGVALHFALKPDHDPARDATWVFITVDDAEIFYAELLAAGADQGRPLRDTDYGMRQIANIDPDGNMLLFGSPTPRDGSPGERAPATPRAPRTAPELDANALSFARALKRGDVAAVTELLATDPGLALTDFEGRSPLHLYADAPGHRPNPAPIVQALAAVGAHLDAHARASWHHETPLHWAASNDDVALIDALLDAGADIEHPGSSIGGGPPIQSAVGYGQWAALARLYERGASVTFGIAGALGELALIEQMIAAKAPVGADLSVAFSNAVRAGQREAAALLLERGAELDWLTPWSDQTALDLARTHGRHELAAWLEEIGAHSCAQLRASGGAA